MAEVLHIRDDFDGGATDNMGGRSLPVQVGVSGVSWVASPFDPDSLFYGAKINASSELELISVASG